MKYLILLLLLTGCAKDRYENCMHNNQHRLIEDIQKLCKPLLD